MHFNEMRMRQQDFQKLLQKYRRGLCTPEEEALIDEWFRAMDAVDVHLPDEEVVEIRRRSFTRVRKHVAGSREGSPTRGRTFWAVAATVTILALAAATFLLRLPATQEIPSIAGNGERRVSNTTAKVLELALQDGSRVFLKPKSTISWREPFTTERQVCLEGEAFFTVTKDSLHPFLVNTRDVVTKVLGTSFLVSAFKEDVNVTVEVMTGKVSVMTKRAPGQSQEHPEETILTPNQKIIYNKQKHLTSRGLVNKPLPTVSHDVISRMHFEEAPVKEIFQGLEKVYGVEIDFDERTFRSCILTTSIGGGSLYSRLDMICKAIEATYTVEENRIVIAGNGCGQNPGSRNVSP